METGSFVRLMHSYMRCYDFSMFCYVLIIIVSCLYVCMFVPVTKGLETQNKDPCAWDLSESKQAGSVSKNLPGTGDQIQPIGAAHIEPLTFHFLQSAFFVTWQF